MIPLKVPLRQAPAWQIALAQAIRDPHELMHLLNLEPALLPAACVAARLFPLRVPRSFVTRMVKGNADDPLLRQVLPLAQECQPVSGYSIDPVGDRHAMVVPGVLHKYQGRALLTVTGACAVHCRYCFRRHFPYADANPAVDGWRDALTYIASDQSISEVILSGGDPLSLPDRRLADLVNRLATIPHVQRLRVHTRLPIVIPERVDDQLLAWLTNTRLQTVVVVHSNHANEIDNTVVAAMTRLKEVNGITLLNQSVLLYGVNNNVDALADLSEALFSAGVLPYYMHVLDRVQGAAHFDVDENTARGLLSELSARLPGYLVPRLVREVAGAAGKQWL